MTTEFGSIIYHQKTKRETGRCFINVNIELSPKKRTLVMFSVLVQHFAFLMISFGNGAALPTIVENFGQSSYYALVGLASP